MSLSNSWYKVNTKEEFMSGKGIITNLFICPRCQEGMSANSRPIKCLKCGFKFAQHGESKLTEKFESGKAPYDQLFELVQQDMEKFMDQPANKFIPGMSKEKAEGLRISNKQRLAYFQGKRKAEMHRFFETVPLSEMEGWLKSTLHFYQCLLRRADKESIVAACSFGEQIGRISEHTKKLVELGVQTYDGANSAPTEGDNKRSDTSS